MRALWRKPGAAPAAVAVLMLVQLAAVFVFLHASADGVSIGGTSLGGTCYFRQRTGLPCPTCGMTRSVALSLHGQIASAVGLNPAGPLWVLAMLVTAVALLWLAWRQRAPEAARAAAARRVRVLALAHGGAVGIALAFHWVYALFAAT